MPRSMVVSAITAIPVAVMTVPRHPVMVRTAMSVDAQDRGCGRRCKDGGGGLGRGMRTGDEANADGAGKEGGEQKARHVRLPGGCGVYAVPAKRGMTET